MGRHRRRLISAFTSASLARTRFESVFRRIQNRPRLEVAQICVNPAPGLGRDLISVLRPDAGRGQAGYGEQREVWRIQARPSLIGAVGCPVISRAAWAWLAGPPGPGLPGRLGLACRAAGEAHLKVSGSAVTPPGEGSRAAAPGRAVFWIVAGRYRLCLATSC